jgi:hypothetical protein
LAELDATLNQLAHLVETDELIAFMQLLPVQRQALQNVTLRIATPLQFGAQQTGVNRV